jgi:uncharacterized phage infection (PIP) family protein YhgE
MTVLEVIAILILIGAILVLLYYYLQDTRGISLNMRPKTTESRTRTLKVDEETSKIHQTLKKTGAKATSTTSKVTESKTMSGVGERMAGMSEMIRGKVKEVPISTDVLSNRIEAFLNEQSDQLIKDWEIVTKNDLSQLEERFDTVSLNVDALERRFDEYRGYTNKKLDKIEKRLSKLENPEEEAEKSEDTTKK